MDALEIAKKIAHLSVKARLRDLELYCMEGEANRVLRIRKVLDRLDPGVYLVGSGPYSQGVFSLMCDEVVVGRLATPLEVSVDVAVDVLVNDAATLTQREVSRVHCTIYRRQGVVAHDYWIMDRNSTCGTYLNGTKLPAPVSALLEDVAQASHTLSHGDIITLGASGINSFFFVDFRSA